MVTRILIILALVLQPLWAAGSMPPAPCQSNGPAPIAAAGCCGTAMTCCTAMGRVCTCAVEEAPVNPVEPRTPPGSTVKTQVLAGLPTPPAPMVASASAERVVAGREACVSQSHNQRQSLLCVWRT